MLECKECAGASYMQQLEKKRRKKMIELNIESLTEHKQELIRYENDNNADFSAEIIETDKIIRRITSGKIKALKAKLWVHEQECTDYNIKIPKHQMRLQE